MKKVFSLLIVSLLLVFLNAADEHKYQKNEKRIIVSGADYVEMMPDTAYFNIGFSIQRDNPEECANLGEQVRKNIKLVFNDLNISKEEIIEDSASVNDWYDWELKKTQNAYRYSARLKLADFSKITKLRKKIFNQTTFAPVKDSWLTRRGLTADSNVSYEIVKNLGEAQQSAIKKAYERAILKIQGIADAGSLKYSIFKVSEGNTRTYAMDFSLEATPRMAKSMAKDAAGNTDETLPTLQRISAEVTVEAEIL